MADLDRLFISTESLNCAELLAEWDWLLDRPYEPVGMTPFGDWFLIDHEMGVYLLDVAAGRVFLLAPSMEEFQEAMQDPENQERWFRASLFDALERDGVRCEAGQCYGYKVPPVQGGRLTVDNIEPTDMLVHQSAMGQLHRQVKDLPVAQAVEGVRVEPPGATAVGEQP